MQIKEKDVHSVPTNEIVLYLIECINKGYYVILDLNYKKLLDCNSSDFQLHETLIYGYDSDKRIFFTPLLKNGSFKKVQITYETLCRAYNDSINYFLSNKNQKFNRRMWFLGITLLKPKKNYRNPNAIYDFINKVRLEQEGYCFQRQSLENSQTYMFYTGVSCLKRLAQLLNNYIKRNNRSDDDLKKYQMACLKIYQNQNIILYSMEWFLRN